MYRRYSTSMYHLISAFSGHKMLQRKYWKVVVTLVLITSVVFYITKKPLKRNMDVVFPNKYSLSKQREDTVNKADHKIVKNHWLPRQSPKHQACVHPKLDIEETRSRQKKVDPINCTKEFDWVITKVGRFFINSVAVNKHGAVQCDYTPIFKTKNDNMEYGKVVKDYRNNTELISDAFKVECKAADNSTYTNVHTAIKIRHDILKARTADFNKDGMGVSVVMYGIDSLSRPMFQVQLPKTHDYFVNKLGGILLEGYNIVDSLSRPMFQVQLPKTHDYFVNKLGGILLEGYNIVGDGTTQAITPMLTGKEETELPETRRGYSGSQTVDVYPFIWKQFEKEGFITQFIEDEPGIGTFNYRLLGFHSQPVHHYTRPFYIAANVFKKNTLDDYCLGSIPRYKLGLNVMKESFAAYKGVGQFALNFHTELSHDDNNKAQNLDDGSVDFLKFMENNGHLNNTVFILFSDHGARFGEDRATERGKLEERMPYFGFLFPSWFQNKYPKEMDNFRINTQRLTTPFDIHETLTSLLYRSNPQFRNLQHVGISLFNEIPPERTCAHAHVQPHWCACMKWTPMSRTENESIAAANAVIRLMNGLLTPYLDQCHELKLGTIKSSAKYVVENALLKFLRSKDRDGRFPELSDDMKSREELYRVVFVTEPGLGLFEATLKRDINIDLYTADAEDISRLNMYGDAPKCIANQVPHLRPYCLCKNAS